MSSLKIVLAGKCFQGKSSTGNTLLRKEIITETHTSRSVTQLINKKTAEIDGTLLEVYEMPGLMDPELNTETDGKIAFKSIDEIMNISGGIDAFMFVFRYNTGFCSEDVQTITVLEEIFGQTFLQNHGVIVITHEDNFLSDVPHGENPDHFFKNWCSSQKPKFRELIRKVGGRIVLVCNKSDTYHKDLRMRSSERLFQMAKHLKESKGTYTKKMYDDDKGWLYWLKRKLYLVD